jgi:hypothetical protein
MSATSRRRKLNDLRRKAKASAGQPKTYCVLSLNTYLGDGEDSASFGFAGINDIFEEMFTEYQVRSLSPS